MAIRYTGELDALLKDLKWRGFRVTSAKRIPGAPGRSADVYLENGVIVRWDPFSQTVWADGPLISMRRVERYLRQLYEGGAMGRVWARRTFLPWRLLRTFEGSTQTSASPVAAPVATASHAQ
jgi:hypothetical protein